MRTILVLVVVFFARVALAAPVCVGSPCKNVAVANPMPISFISGGSAVAMNPNGTKTAANSSPVVAALPQAVATAAVTVGATATSMGSPPSTRSTWAVQNNAAVDIFCGGSSGVTTSTGWRISAKPTSGPSDFWAFDVAAAQTLYCIAASGTAATVVAEVTR